MMGRKKVVRKRGQRTHGHGSRKKWRGTGNRGGRGMAGSGSHKMTYLRKYDPTHLGKKGFVSKRGGKMKTINLRELDRMAGKSGKVDLTAMGYDKVLGTGEIKSKLEVKASCFSARAREKIEKAGGRAVSGNEQAGEKASQ